MSESDKAVGGSTLCMYILHHKHIYFYGNDAEGSRQVSGTHPCD